MRVRSLLILTGVVSSLLGAVVTYFVLTVPNDLKADALLKTAKTNLAAGKETEARDSLSQIIQQHPRTDAAAAAMVALIKLDDQKGQRLEKQVTELQQQLDRDRKSVGDLSSRVTQIANAPPKTVVVQAPPPPANKTTARKPTSSKSSKKKSPSKTTRRRRG